jgi:flagellar M-ring protein FliF
MAERLSTMGLSPAVSAGLRPLLLLAGLAAAVAVGVGVTLWTKGPTYSVLYATLPDQDAAAVTKSLAGAGIDYRMEPGSGGISVPAARLNEARMLLAEEGTLSAGGFATLSKENGFGLSQFMEGARYQHALEQELATTISSMQQVASARVHIATARNSTFIRDRSPGRASVFVQLKAGRRLSSEQVNSIVNLVGSAVPDIDASQITVVDQGGRLLSSPRGRDEMALRDQQIEFARQMEEMYAQRIEALISPLVGPGRVKAEVSAQYDMSAIEEARERFSPESAVVRSEQLSEERSGASSVAAGVPGSQSNQPNADPQAAATQRLAQQQAATPGTGTEPAPGAPVQPGAGNPTRTIAGSTIAGGMAGALTGAPGTMQATRNYEIDRTVAYLRQPGGRLQRLSVAVLVDNMQVPGRDGKMTDTPLSRDQINRITTLVKDAVGFDASRGDSVSVVNSPWRGEPRLDDGEMTSIAFWERAWFIDVMKVLAGMMALVALVLFVLKPLGQKIGEMLTAPPRPPGDDDEDFVPPTRIAGPSAQATPSVGGELAVASAPIDSGARKRKGLSKYDENVQTARALVNEDPARVAQVVRKWAMNNG